MIDMRKHYTFIPLKETDLNSFSKALISTLWFRPFACLIALVILAGMGYIKRDVITSKITVLMLFSLAIGLVVFAVGYLGGRDIGSMLFY